MYVCAREEYFKQFYLILTLLFQFNKIPGISNLIHAFYHECQGNKLPITKFANETHHYPFIVICGFGGSGDVLQYSTDFYL